MSTVEIPAIAEDVRSDNKEKVTKFFVDLLAGRRIVEVKKETLVLDNSVALTLFESMHSCCACAHGDWRIIDGAQEMGITDVEVNYGSRDDEDESFLTITILHDNNPIAHGDCTADAGNGHYFSVLSLRVEIPNKDTLETELLYS